MSRSQPATQANALSRRSLLTRAALGAGVLASGLSLDTALAASITARAAAAPISTARAACASLSAPRNAASMIARSSAWFAASVPMPTWIPYRGTERKSVHVRVGRLQTAEELRHVKGRIRQGV